MNIPAFPLSSGSVDRARTLLNDTQSNFNQIHTVGYGNKSDFISIELRPKPNLSTETTCRAQRPLSHEHSAGSVHDQVFGEHRAASGKRGVQSGHRRGSLARPRRARCGWCYGRVTRHVRRHALLGCGLHLRLGLGLGLGLGMGSKLVLGLGLGLGVGLGLGLGIGLRLTGAAFTTDCETRSSLRNARNRG